MLPGSHTDQRVPDSYDLTFGSVVLPNNEMVGSGSRLPSHRRQRTCFEYQARLRGLDELSEVGRQIRPGYQPRDS
jgi:hypothetical protein